MTKRFHSFLPALFCLMLGLCVSVSQGSQFWADEIGYSLESRDKFLKSIDLTEKDFLSIKSWINSQKQQFSNRISSMGNSDNPWYNYIYGLIQEEGSENQKDLFRKAIRVSSGDPGTLWLLSLEHIRNDQLSWAEESLQGLEKNLFNQGATAAPTISQQLLLAGRTLETQSKSTAEFCYKWAGQFDRTQSWSAFQNARIHFPGKIVTTFTSLIDGFEVIGRSWRSQHALAFNLYRLLRIAVIIFIIVVFTIFSFKYLPSAIHILDDKLFSGLPLKYRSFASSATVLSLLSFGLLPFLWTIALLTRRFLAKGEKGVMTFICVIMLLSPLDSWVQSIFLDSASMSQTPQIFTRATTEGFSEELHQTALKNARENPSDHLAYLSVSISAIKGNDHNTSAEALRKALQLSPEDPITLLTAGNISFLLGNQNAVEQYYDTLIKKHPRNLEVKFNLGQFQIEKGGSITATELIDQAADLHPAKVNQFIEKNDIYYSGDSPPLRRLMQPELSPFYFWTKRFLHHGGSLTESGALWGTTFFGLGPITSLILFSILFATLLILDSVYWNNNSRVKELFNCKICGRLICRRCRKGTKCLSCHEESQYVRSASSVSAQQRNHLETKRKRKIVLNNLLGLVVPGSDKMFKGDKTFSSLIHIALSSLILSAYITAATLQTRYPQNTTLNLFLPLSILMIYNVFFLIKHGLTLKNVLLVKNKK
ncbi:MAG: tetratricopeptide repeat protein [Chitinispirillaceae bacterium]